MIDQLRKHCVEKLREALEAIGIPTESIVTGYVIRKGKDVLDPDIVVMGTDNETIVAAFDIKVMSDSKDGKYRRALRTWRNVMARCACYLVVPEGTGSLHVARLAEKSLETAHRWINVSDKKNLLELVGRYPVESSAAIADKRVSTTEAVVSSINWAALISGFVGLLFTLGAGFVEWHYRREFSWKIYSVFFTTVIIVLTASGYSIHLKHGEDELWLGRRPCPKSDQDDLK